MSNNLGDYMKNQKNFVCECLLEVLSERSVEFVLNGDVNIKDVLNDSDVKEVRRRVCDGFENNEIQMSDKSRDKYIGNEKELSKYVGGLVNNWIRKCKEFNGGNNYQPKNPGSRKGSGDEMVREMRKLLKTITNQEVRNEIELEIKKRIELINPESVIVIDSEKLPQHLQYLVK